MSHDCLRGYGSWHDFNRLGTRILIFGNGDVIIIMLNLQKSDIRNKFKKSCVNAHPNCKTCVFLLKIYLSQKKDIDMFSFTNNETVTWRGQGAGVKNKIQGAGPCFGWIFADDLQRLAPQGKRFASPGQSSIDRTWWDKFKNFVSTRALIAKHVFFYWRYICPCKRVHIDMFSFTNI